MSPPRNQHETKHGTDKGIKTHTPKDTEGKAAETNTKTTIRTAPDSPGPVDRTSVPTGTADTPGHRGTVTGNMKTKTGSGRKSMESSRTKGTDKGLKTYTPKDTAGTGTNTKSTSCTNPDSLGPADRTLRSPGTAVTPWRRGDATRNTKILEDFTKRNRRTLHGSYGKLPPRNYLIQWL